MKLDCEKARQLLAEDEATSDLQSHIRDCSSCSNIASGLTLLDQGIKSAPRYSPPSDLNNLVVFKVTNNPSKADTPVYEAKALSSHWIRVSSLAVIVCLCFSLLDLMKLEPGLKDTGEIRNFVLSLASKNFLDFAQLGVVIGGLLFLGFSSVRKVMVCGVLFFSVFFIEALRFYFR